MIVSNMILRLRYLMDDAVEPFETSDDMMFAWLNDAYLRIQMQSTWWKFLHNRGLLLTTVANTPTYALGSVREVDQQSLYLIRGGETARLPIMYKEYADWVLEESYATETPGTPRWILQEPGESLRLSPVPDGVYNLYGDVRYYPTGFSDLGDEPIWDELYHDLVWLEALKIGGERCELELYKKQIVAELTRLPGLFRSFCQRYLPRIRGAGALV